VSSLFRQEVTDDRQVRAIGRILPFYRQPTFFLTSLLIVTTLAAALWIILGSFSRLERVVGWVVPNGATAQVIPTRPGLLTELFVKDGQSVRRGDKLARVAVRQSSTGFEDPGEASLAAVRSQREAVDAQLDLNERTRKQETKRLQASAKSLRDRIAALQSQLVLQRQQVATANSNAANLDLALQQKYISRIEYQTRKSAIIESQQQLQQLRAALADLTGQRAEVEAQLTQLSTTSDQRSAELRLRRAAFDEQEVSVSQSNDYFLTAPVDGLITGLQFTPGQTVTVATPVLAVVAEGATIEVELFAPSRAVGFAKPGQEVRLLYDAYPFQQFGSYKGRIISISNTVYRPAEINAPVRVEEPVYRIKVAVDEPIVTANGQRFTVRPGMTLAGNIVLERQSFLDWLLQPVRSLRNRSS
jgi:membrane fusion protein